MGTRTTIVLDEDVLERVRERARQEAVPFRTKLNDLVREGLAKSGEGKPTRLVIKAFPMGQCALPFPLRVSDLDASEDEEKFRRRG